MKPQVALFAAAFVVGALAALAARSAWHDPYDGHHTAAPPTAPAPMVDNATPSQKSASTATAPIKKAEAAHHDHAAEHQPPSAPAEVLSPTNTICPICGMPVDPNLPTAAYGNRRVGFGCKACLPKFEADPNRYGPAALSNETVE